jgi:O-antigen ligase
MQLKLSDLIYVSYLLLAFMIPIGSFVITYAVIFIILAWIININWKEKLFILRQHKWVMLFPILYLAYVLGALYSSNHDEAQFKLIQKLSLIIIPLIVFSTPVLTQKLMNLILFTFCMGCISILLVYESVAIIKYFEYNQSKYFFYGDFVLFMHPSYLSLSFNIAFAYSLYRFLFKNNSTNSIQNLYGLFAFVFSIAILQCSSKAGILSLGLVIIVLAYHFIKMKYYPSMYRLGVSLFCIALIFFSIEIFSTQLRLDSMKKVEQVQEIKNSESESSGVRILVWKSALHLIKQSPFIGFGTGDVSDQLIHQYEINNYTGALAKKLNAHNQYLQITLSIGLIGLAIFISLLMIMFFISLRDSHYMASVFVILITFNYLVESMLELRDGIIFFTFISSILFSFIINSDKRENKNLIGNNISS